MSTNALLLSLALFLPSFLMAASNRCTTSLQNEMSEKEGPESFKIGRFLDEEYTKAAQNLIRIELNAQEKIDLLWEKTGLYQTVNIRRLEVLRQALIDEEQALWHHEASSLRRYDLISSAISGILKEAALDPQLTEDMSFRSSGGNSGGNYSYFSAKHFLLDKLVANCNQDVVLERLFKNQKKDLAEINSLGSQHLKSLRLIREIQILRQTLPEIPEEMDDLELILQKIEVELEIRKITERRIVESRLDSQPEIDFLLNLREKYQTLQNFILFLRGRSPARGH